MKTTNDQPQSTNLFTVRVTVGDLDSWFGGRLTKITNFFYHLRPTLRTFVSMSQGPFYSIMRSKCPKCNLGDMYADSNMYNLKKLGQMKLKCEYCGQPYEPETGFYYGAMYVSYALSIIAMFIPAYTFYFLFDLGFGAMLAIVLGIYVGFFPVFFRLSRNIWLNIFVKFSPEARAKALEKKI